MSSRVTRSAARRAADSSAAPAAATSTSDPALQPSVPGKRRVTRREQSPGSPAEPTRPAAVRRSKRQKVEEPEVANTTTSTRPQGAKHNAGATMSASGPSSDPPIQDTSNPSEPSSKKKTNRSKKTAQDNSPPAPQPASRRVKKVNAKKHEDTVMQDVDEGGQKPTGTNPAEPKVAHERSVGADESGLRTYDEDDGDHGDDPFRGGFLSRAGGLGGLSQTMRALSGMMSGSGTGSRLREILEHLRRKDDPSVQIIALGDLSQLLLVSNEDNLSGHFVPDHFVKELVTLMQPNEFGEENPEMMLLSCRCLANLMEALPPATASVVYGGAVPVLCLKLLEINYIDLAEQALSTLEKISVEFPASIVREGGLTACLTFLEFFATGTQRTAVTTAANCCRNIPEESFPVVRDVMPILRHVLNGTDQRVVEQGSLCVSRIVESFKYQFNRLEELVSRDLLRGILRLLIPGTTNLIGPHIHTQFLRVLAFTARASPTRSAELFEMDIVDTLYQILTGVSPPSDDEDVASKIDGVIIMQAIIHRPRDQIFETLNVICELLPGVSTDGLVLQDSVLDASYSGDDLATRGGDLGSRNAANVQRKALLEPYKLKVKRFATILLPTLTHAYSSTVNLNVRQKVLTAQLKMISNLDTEILENALRSVPFASYLTSILSQQDHPILVLYALQAAELLIHRLEPIYGYRFCREGVMAEIARLSGKPLHLGSERGKTIKAGQALVDDAQEGVTKAEPADDGRVENDPTSTERNDIPEEDDEDDEQEGDEEEDDGDEEDEGNEEGEVHHAIHEGLSSSPSTSSASEGNYQASSLTHNLEDYVTLQAKKFLEVYQSPRSAEAREKANAILQAVKFLAKNIKDYHSGDLSHDIYGLFRELARYFTGDPLQSITSAELLGSDVVDVLLDAFGRSNDIHTSEARTAFLEVFLGDAQASPNTDAGVSHASPFSILIRKLQDLLSRAEHFEVITVHNNSFDSNRNSAASMLAKQLRLKLVAGEDSDIPRPYRNIMVSIHAIATFKALDDYLRPRISLSERSRGGRHPEGLSGTIAAMAAAAGLPSTQPRFVERSLLGIPDTPALPTPSTTTPSSRASRKTAKPKAPGPAGSTAPETPTAPEKPAASRRSSRRHQASTETTVAAPVEPAQEALECADERQITDDEDPDDSGTLDAIVDDIDDDMDEDLPDPSAVNLEVAVTGKVTARQEDGTRIPTPSLGGTPAHAPPPRMRASLPAHTAAARAMSYAAAIQSIPQDWHIEFSIDGQAITNETTIYRAVHYDKAQPDEPSSRNVWSNVHPIKFRRVSGPPPPEPSSITPPPEQNLASVAAELPTSLHKHPMTSKILRLLNILHELNANLDDVLDEHKESYRIKAESVAQFVNTKLTAKLNRQLEEPLIVASSCLPSWSEDLARLYPFLFPFETRQLFLQSTSFGYSRSMQRWQNAQSTDDTRRDRHRDERPFLGRLQRQKVRISRSRILESAVKVMELYGASPSMLEVEYFEEVGTGLGPTLEFYSTVSKEFCKKKTKLWRENDSSARDEYAFGKLGLFPAPMSAEQVQTENGKRILHLFTMMGKFVARSMLDSRIIDISFNPTFFKVDDASSAEKFSLAAIKTVDTDLAKSLKLIKQFATMKRQIDDDVRLPAPEKVKRAQAIEIRGARVDDLGLDFTLPGYPAIELIENGSNIPVTIENIEKYLSKVIEFTLGSGVKRQITAFRNGFSQVFPYSALKAFTPAELVMMFGRTDEDWSIETLMDSIKADHGFNMDSKSIRNLLQTMSELTPAQRRDFLQFVTGSPKLPIGGFKSLTPMFTVVCKPSEPPLTSDDYLPSVMTCVNYLKLPDYTDLDVMRTRLNTAIREGQGAFHLS